MLNEKDNLEDNLSSSSEDYLKAIYLIISEKEAVRPKDIAVKLNVSNASVTVALKGLNEKGMIDYAPFDAISLTPEGRKVALEVIRRYDLLKYFFEKILGIDSNIAESTAHMMEHDLSPIVVDKLAKFSEFLEICPRAGIRWLQEFNANCDKGITAEICEKCVSRVSRRIKIKEKRISQGKIKSVILNTLKSQERGKIVRIFEKGLAKKKLEELGLVLGAIVEIEKAAPIGVGFVELKVQGQKILLKKEDIGKVEVEILK